jgi:excisionase family DNA binding protein
VPRPVRDPPLLLTVSEAARLLGIAERTLYRDVKDRGRWACAVVPYGQKEIRFSRLALLELLKDPARITKAA